MKMTNFYKLILFVAFCAVNVLSASAQNDLLQELIDNLATATTRASGTPTDIDLSAYSEPRTTTLYVRNGVSVRFVNGTLKRAATLKGPLVEVSGGSRLELGEKSAISANKVVLGYEVVKLNNGILVANEGGVYGYKEDTPVLMTNDNDICETRGGGSVESIKNTASKAKIYIYYNYYSSSGKIIRKAIKNNGTDAVPPISYVNYPQFVETNGPVYVIEGSNTLAGVISAIAANLTGTNYIVKQGAETLKINIKITAKKKKAGDVVVKAENHTFTQEELAKFSLVDMDDCELALKNNQIVIQKKVTAVTDGQTLQQRLDEIAAKGTSSLNNPETIEIPAEGITIDSYLQVRNGCHAKLTGGPIRISPSIGAHYPIWIWNSCSLVFENITIDFMNNGFKTHSGIFDIFGDLTINKGVQFVNVPQSKGDYGECLFGLYGGTFTYRDGTIKAKGVSIVGERFNKGGTVNIYGGELETTGVPVISGKSLIVNLGYCKFKGAAEAIIIANHIEMHDGVTIEDSGSTGSVFLYANTVNIGDRFPILKGNSNSRIIIMKSLEVSGSCALPLIVLGDNAVITVSYKLTHKWTIASYNWNNFILEKAIVKGDSYHKLTAADFNQMTFQGLPNDLEAYYDAKDYSVKLRKKTVVEEKVDNSDDLQNFIDGLGDNKGTEDDPIKVPVGDDGLVIDKDVDIEDDLQLLIDGTGRDDLQILIDGGYINQKVGLGYFGFKNLWMGSSAGTRASASGGGINNRGKMVFSNSTLADGTYSINNLAGGTLILKENTVAGSSDGLIVNSGNVYLDGTVSVGNLENKTGGRIYITEALTENINIRFTSENDIEFNTPIIMGEESYSEMYYNYYTLTENDLSHINISLPEGYAWKYSEDMGGVVVYATSGISGLDADRPSVVGTYDTTGRKVTETRRGVHIQRMSNGEVRKIVIK